MKRDTCIVVAPDSTGLHLAPALQKLGVLTVAGVSSNAPPLDLGAYDQLVDVGDGSCWPEALDPNRILRVVAGSDLGGPPADRLAHSAGLSRKNDLTLTLARRDKWVMGEVLRNAGIPCARQALLVDMPSVERWITINPNLSVVLKPRKGIASDQVHLCHSDTEIRTAADALLGSKDFFGNDNTTLLVQEFLPGLEFMIDTVSLDGAHYVVGIWQSYRRRTGTVLPLYVDAVNPTSPTAQQVISYCHDVLDTLGVSNGPAHTEIMLVPNRGPVLIEMNARFHGSMDLDFARCVFGTDQVIETAQSIATQDWHGPKQVLQLRGFGRKIYLHSPVSGTASHVPDYSALEQLSSFHSIRNRILPKKEVRETVSLSTSPATLFLASDNEEEIIADTQKVRQLEAAIFNNIVME